jgi:hypothetical protein
VEFNQLSALQQVTKDGGRGLARLFQQFLGK